MEYASQGRSSSDPVSSAMNKRIVQLEALDLDSPSDRRQYDEIAREVRTLQDCIVTRENFGFVRTRSRLTNRELGNKIANLGREVDNVSTRAPGSRERLKNGHNARPTRG